MFPSLFRVRSLCAPLQNKTIPPKLVKSQLCLATLHYVFLENIDSFFSRPGTLVSFDSNVDFHHGSDFHGWSCLLNQKMRCCQPFITLTKDQHLKGQCSSRSFTLINSFDNKFSCSTSPPTRHVNYFKNKRLIGLLS